MTTKLPEKYNGLCGIGLYCMSLCIGNINMSECSKCQKKIGFLNWMKISNPYKIKCSQCKSIMGLNSKGLKWFYISMGIFIPLISIQGYLVANSIGTFGIRNLILGAWFIPLYFTAYKLTINNIENKV